MTRLVVSLLYLGAALFMLCASAIMIGRRDPGFAGLFDLWAVMFAWMSGGDFVTWALERRLKNDDDKPVE